MGMDLPPALPAQVEVSDTVERYRIEGKSSSELWRQMNSLGPIDQLSGKRMSGYAKWRISWSFEYAEEGGACRITDHKVRLDVTITLPEWIGAEKASEKLRGNWAQFLERLEFHERGHRDIGVQAATAVSEALAAAGPRKQCLGYGDYLNVAAKQAMARFAQSDASYDARTDHGRTQGVVLR